MTSILARNVWWRDTSGVHTMKTVTSRSNPMAKDLRQPKYKQQVIPDKKKPKPFRKKKHKGKDEDVWSRWISMVAVVDTVDGNN
jgi:hypothetical protein